MLVGRQAGHLRVPAPCLCTPGTASVTLRTLPPPPNFASRKQQQPVLPRLRHLGHPEQCPCGAWPGRHGDGAGLSRGAGNQGARGPLSSIHSKMEEETPGPPAPASCCDPSRAKQSAPSVRAARALHLLGRERGTEPSSCPPCFTCTWPQVLQHCSARERRRAEPGLRGAAEEGHVQKLTGPRPQPRHTQTRARCPSSPWR